MNGVADLVYPDWEVLASAAMRAQTHTVVVDVGDIILSRNLINMCSEAIVKHWDLSVTIQEDEPCNILMNTIADINPHIPHDTMIK